MNDLMAFLYETAPVRVTDLAGEPWFVAADVCSILEIKQATRAVEPLDADEKGVSTIQTKGGPQELLIVSESGLYTLIFNSRKPFAKRFRKWVTSEVLPAIRKTGRYGTAPVEPPFSDDQRMEMTIGQIIDLRVKAALWEDELRKRDTRAANKKHRIEEVQEMRRLRAAGWKLEEIADRFGRSIGSVSQLTRDIPAADASQTDLFGREGGGNA